MKKKIAPYFADIFKEFKTKVAENNNLRQSNGEVFKPFTCSEWTFRKILRKLGYKYGKINMRDAILIRPDIVTWRGKYLNALRKNKLSQNPMKIIYLDGAYDLIFQIIFSFAVY